ncbi:uncharacterized protein LOC116059833 isoform X2 [Sander lucioperca]|nr:uncharacterized protein LOC116059833 isoform X2 [Sander lucioperca]
MVHSCCAPGCQSYRGKYNERKSFYRIPKDPGRRRKWIAAIKRARSTNSQPGTFEPNNKIYRLCSDHFISGKKSDNPLSPDYVPSVFHHVPSPETTTSSTWFHVFNSIQESRRRRLEKAAKPSAVMDVTDQLDESNDNYENILPLTDQNDHPATPPYDGGHGKPAYEMLESDPDWVPSLHLDHREPNPRRATRLLRSLRQENRDPPQRCTPPETRPSHETETRITTCTPPETRPSHETETRTAAAGGGAEKPAVRPWREARSLLQAALQRKPNFSQQPGDETLGQTERKTDVNFRDLFRGALEASLDAYSRSRALSARRPPCGSWEYDVQLNVNLPSVKEEKQTCEEESSSSSSLSCVRLQSRNTELEEKLSGLKEEPEYVEVSTVPETPQQSPWSAPAKEDGPAYTVEDPFASQEADLEPGEVREMWELSEDSDSDARPPKAPEEEPCWRVDQDNGSGKSCGQKCRKRCWERISEARREALHAAYCNMSYDAKKAFVSSCVPRRQTAVRSGAGVPSRRKQTLSYHFTDELGLTQIVCKTFFLTTLGYHQRNDRFVQTAIGNAPRSRNERHEKCAKTADRRRSEASEPTCSQSEITVELHQLETGDTQRWNVTEYVYSSTGLQSRSGHH